MKIEVITVNNEVHIFEHADFHVLTDLCLRIIKGTHLQAIYREWNSVRSLPDDGQDPVLTWQRESERLQKKVEALQAENSDLFQLVEVASRSFPTGFYVSESGRKWQGKYHEVLNRKVP